MIWIKNNLAFNLIYNSLLIIRAKIAKTKQATNIKLREAVLVNVGTMKFDIIITRG